MYFHLRTIFEYSLLCFCDVYPFGFFVMIFPFPYFAPKPFWLIHHPVVGMASPIPYPLLVGRIFFYCFGKSCFVCIVWSCLGIFLVFHFLPVFSLVFSSCIFRSSCRAFPASSEYIFMFCFSIFAYCRSFLTCASDLNSQPGLDFL